MGKRNIDYAKKLEEENKIKLLEEFKGTKKHHKMQCLICGYVWSATPAAKFQAKKKRGSNGCPNCNEMKKQEKYEKIRKKNLERLKKRGIIVLDKNYDGRIYLDYKNNPHKKIKVKNINCGHVFYCSPANLLLAETECSVCGPQKRAKPLIEWSKRRSEEWRKTAPEWKKYKSIVYELTRQTYKKYKNIINPNNLPRGKAGVEGAYHLDHIVPIRFCFENNIPPEVCASVENLQMMEWKDNVQHRNYIKGSLPSIFIPYIAAGERIEKYANIIKKNVLKRAKLFQEIDGITLTLYDKTNNIGILIIPIDRTFANMKIASKALKIMQDNNIRHFIIFEDECQKMNLIINKISHYLGKSKIEKKIHARKCEIKEIKNSKEKTEFLNKYHIQGADASNIAYGAYYDNELVAVMTFSKPRVVLGYKNEDRSTYDKIWELSRFATNINYRIPGIASKLLKHFMKNNEWKKIISYADRRWSNQNDNLYIKLGFEEATINPPDYFYIVDGKRKHRWNFRKDRLKEIFDGYDPSKTEYENVENMGYFRLWDCGTIRYEMINEKEINKENDEDNVLIKYNTNISYSWNKSTKGLNYDHYQTEFYQKEWYNNSLFYNYSKYESEI